MHIQLIQIDTLIFILEKRQTAKGSRVRSLRLYVFFLIVESKKEHSEQVNIRVRDFNRNKKDPNALKRF